MTRPRIGVTGPDRGGQAAWWFSALGVRLAGGKPTRIRPGKDPGIDRLDALIIGGGADVSPGLYGQQPRIEVSDLHDRGVPRWRRVLGVVLFPLIWLARRCLTKKRGGLDPGRDELEGRLIRKALEKRLPLFGDLSRHAIDQRRFGRHAAPVAGGFLR